MMRLLASVASVLPPIKCESVGDKLVLSQWDLNAICSSAEIFLRIVNDERG